LSCTVKLASLSITSSGDCSKRVAARGESFIAGSPWGIDIDVFFLGDFALTGEGEGEFGLDSVRAERVGRNGEEAIVPGYEWEVVMVNGGTSPRREGSAESKSETNATSARFSSSSFNRI
jgi:hypothetical protein